MFHRTKELEIQEGGAWARSSWTETSRRALARGVQALAEVVSALHSPRSSTVEGRGMRAPARSSLQAVEQFAELPEDEEVGASLLRKAAQEVWNETGHGVGDVVCLTASLILESLEALEEGASVPTLRTALEQARDRLLMAAEEFTRPARSGELQALLLSELQPRHATVAGIPDHTFLVPGRLPGAEVHYLEGTFVSVSPQGAGSLPLSGTWDGPHRVLHLSAPLRTLEELRRLFRQLASFEMPLLLLASRVSPSVATAAASLALEGRLPGHVLWIAPRDEDGLSEEEPSGRGFANRGLPAPISDLEAAHHSSAKLPVASRILWVEEGAILDVPSRKAVNFSALLVGEDVRQGPGLAKTLKLLKRVRQRGFLPGAGSAYLALGRLILARNATPLPLDRCLEAPVRALLENERMDAETVLDRLRGFPPGAGYDLLERRYFLSSEDGPVTPTPIVESVLVTAFDTALMALDPTRVGEGDHAQGS